MEFYKVKNLSLPDNYLDMYSPKIIREGIEFLDIKDVNEIFDILKSCKQNRIYLKQVSDEKTKRLEFVNRFAIPKGLTKKEYQTILKETQKRIDDLLAQERIVGPDNGVFLTIEREDYIDKKLKIKKILSFHNDYGTGSLEKAKAYPIEQLIDFNSAGFAKCLWHDERSPSLKWYPKRNKCHCFAGCGDFDSIDVYMKINNVTLPEAIKKLS